MIKIEPLSTVNPSTYNPRTADPKRLHLIELSLRKLGFIAPIYADENGEILSGHQRHFVATRMGVKNVPVFRIPAMELDKRKALNIVFNRATNDGDICQTPERAKRILETLNFSELAKNISDKELESREFFRCAYPSKVSVAKLCKINAGRWIQYSKSIARTLRKVGIIMPIVCTPDGKVVNGIGRLEMLAELKADTCDVVYITEAEAKFADAICLQWILIFTRGTKICLGTILFVGQGVFAKNWGTALYLPFTATSLAIRSIFSIPRNRLYGARNTVR